jgi:hypothetical protein
MDSDMLMSEQAYVRITGGKAIHNGSQVAEFEAGDPAQLYRLLNSSYPKFFKMDSLCKWAWLGAEVLLQSGASGWIYDGLDKRNIAVVLTTTDGCLEVDKRYAETLLTVPSPALFVYTLPNIMLGEICIRHGFTGEQLCSVADDFDAEELLFQVKDLLLNRGATHCLFGKVDVVGGRPDVCLFWADAIAIGSITPAMLQAAYAQ